MSGRTPTVDTGGAQARHGRLRRRSPWRSGLKYAALSLTVVLVSIVGVTGISLLQLTSGIDTVDLGDGGEDVPALSEYSGAFNVLVVGSDSREGQGDQFGGDEYGSGALNDVTMLLHVSEDHSRASVISFPRDLMVDFPTCPSPDGGDDAAAARDQQFNSALGRGGLGCVVNVVESITGLEIPYAAMITFQGVINLSTAVGGVDVCFLGPVSDPYSGLEIEEAGTYALQGDQALAFLRTRHGVGDGSDLARISSQRVFMSSLARTLQSDAVLTDVTRLYQIAQVASDNMTMSTALADIGTMVSMARVLADIPLETMQFVTYPNVPSGARVVPDEALAEVFNEALVNDEPLPIATDGTGQGSEVADPAATDPAATDPAATDPAATDPAATDPAATDPAATETPDPSEGAVGQTADQETCVVPFGYSG